MLHTDTLFRVWEVTGTKEEKVAKKKIMIRKLALQKSCNLVFVKLWLLHSDQKKEQKYNEVRSNNIRQS